VAKVVRRGGYRLEFRVRPNRAAVPNAFSVAVTRNGRPVRGADVTISFAMLDMEMQNQAYRLRETRPGVYAHAAPALVMVGHWGLSFRIAPRRGQALSVVVVDRASG
jgi:YtkA-like